MNVNDYIRPMGENRPYYDENLSNKVLDIYQTFQKRYQKTLYDKSEPTIMALNYLKSRNITKEQIIKHGIGICNSNTEEIPRSQTWSKLDVFKCGLINSKNYDFYANRITIPIKNEQGQIIGFSGRTYIDDDIRYLYAKTIKGFKYSKKSTLYNIENIKDIDDVFLVEGFFDVFALENQGIDNVIALMGIEISNEQINILKKKGIKTITLALDNDNPGQEAMINVANELVKNGFNVNLACIVGPEKDLDEYFANGNSLQKFLNTKINYDLFPFYDILKTSNQENVERMILNLFKSLNMNDIVNNFNYLEKNNHFISTEQLQVLYYDYLKENFNLPNDIWIKEVEIKHKEMEFLEQDFINELKSDSQKLKEFDYLKYFNDIGGIEKIIDEAMFPFNKDEINGIVMGICNTLEIDYYKVKDEAFNLFLCALESDVNAITYTETKKQEFYENIDKYLDNKLDYEIIEWQACFFNAMLRENIIIENLLEEKGVNMYDVNNSDVEQLINNDFDNPNFDLDIPMENQEVNSPYDVNEVMKPQDKNNQKPKITVNTEKPFYNKNQVDIVGTVGNGEKHPLELKTTNSGELYLNFAIFTKHDNEQEGFDTVFATLYGKQAEQVYNKVINENVNYFRFKGTIKTETYKDKEGGINYKNSPSFKINSVESSPNLPYRNDVVVQGFVRNIKKDNDHGVYVVSIVDTYKFTVNGEEKKGSHELIDIISEDQLLGADKSQDIAIKGHLNYNRNAKGMQLVDEQIVLGLSFDQKQAYFNELSQKQENKNKMNM